MSPNCWRSARLLKSTLVDLVDDLAHQLAGLHVVVGVLEHAAHDAAAVAVGRDRKFLQRGEQLVVDEVEQLVAGDAFGVGGPGAPAELLGIGER